MPFSDLLIFYPYILPFLLVVFRLAGLFVFVPVFSNQAIPANIKMLLALALALCVWPTVAAGGLVGKLPPAELIPVTQAILGELSVGLLIGIVVSMTFMGVMLGAHMLSQQMGLSLGAVYDPMFDEQSTVVEQVAFWLTLMVFFVLGGERELVHAVVQSYRTVPLGQGLEPAHMLQTSLGSIQTAFELAVRVGAPGLVAFFLGTLASGFIAKSMPQINMMTLGMSLNLLIGLGMILVSLVGWAVISQEAWRGLFEGLGRVVGG